MLIHCTKKLLDELEILPQNVAEYDPLSSWRANLITVNRRKTVILMCELNRYVVALYGLKSKDFKELDKQIVKAIRNTLLKEGINPEVIERYLAEAGKAVFTRNNDRTQTARLNKACDAVYFALRGVRENYSDDIGVSASRLLVGGTEKDYFYPNEKLLEDLKRFGIEPILKFRGFELTVKLNLSQHDVMRRIIVPTDITFLQLHKVLQAAFDWKNCHLFDFLLLGHGEHGEDANIELVEDEEGLEYRHGNARLMDGITLSEYLPMYKSFLYRYDFGDDWRHYIEVTGVHDDYYERLPALIAGEGNTPPEDVGGKSGYDDFLETLSDPSHEDYEHITKWAKGQGYQEFDFELTSRRVKHSLRW